jgi:hypothetical protein
LRFLLDPACHSSGEFLGARVPFHIFAAIDLALQGLDELLVLPDPVAPLAIARD